MRDHDSSSFRAENFGRSLEVTRAANKGQYSIQYNAPNGSRPPARKPANTSSTRLTLQKADGLLLAANNPSHQTKRNKRKLTSTGFKQQRICIPLAPTRNKIIYQNSLLRRTQFWVRKTFSKPALVKRAS